MSATKNYGFYLEGDDTAKFKEWREKLNGPGQFQYGDD